MPDLRSVWNDTSFSAEYMSGRVKTRLLAPCHRLGGAWQSRAPASFGAARRILRGSAEPAPLPALPPMGSTIVCDGIEMRIDPRMSEHNVRKLMSGRHTRHERALLGEALVDGDRVMELGGGIGMVAISCARRLGGENVASYEASPKMESLIRDNYALNGVSPTLTMAMVGKVPGTRTFHVSERFSRSSAHHAEGETVPVEVPVLAFDDELARHRPTVLVCDIQGGETELFQFADLSSLRLVLVEIHPDMIGIGATNAVKRRIRSAGFREIGRAGQSFLFRRTG